MSSFSCSRTLKSLSSTIEENLSDVFGAHGRNVARYPWHTVALSITVALLCGLGFLSFTPESRTIKLWTPQHNRAIKEYEWIVDTWGYTLRYNEVILKADEDYGALSKDVILDYYTAHQNLVNTSAHVKGGHKKRFPYKYVFDASSQPWVGKSDNSSDATTLVSVCFRAGIYCETATILDVLSYDFDTLNAMSDEDILERVNNESNWVSPNGRYIPKDGVIGGLRYDETDSTRIIGAVALHGLYTLDPAAIDRNNEITDPSREKWELHFVDNLRGSATERRKRTVYKASRVAVYNEAAFNEEFGDAIAQDIGFISYGYTLLICYAAVALGKRDRVHSMAGLALCSMLCVGLSLLGGYGLASAMGFVFSPLHGSLPFLILGLGVDDGFIIAGEYQRQVLLHQYRSCTSSKLSGATDEEDFEEMMSAAMRHAGVSVLITSVTDFVAFSIGSSTLLPALQSFCMFAAFGVLIVFLLNITLFAAAVVINAQRVAASRYDVFCCFKAKDPKQHTMYLVSDFVDYARSNEQTKATRVGNTSVYALERHMSFSEENGELVISAAPIGKTETVSSDGGDTTAVEMASLKSTSVDGVADVNEKELETKDTVEKTEEQTADVSGDGGDEDGDDDTNGDSDTKEKELETKEAVEITEEQTQTTETGAADGDDKDGDDDDDTNGGSDTKLQEVDRVKAKSGGYARFSSVATKERKPFCGCLHRLPERITQKFFKSLAERITSDNRVRGGILFTAFVLVCVCIYGASQLEQDFDVKWFLPDNHYLQKYIGWENKYFSEGKDQTYVAIYTKGTADGFDYFANKELLDSSGEMLRSVNYLHEDVWSDWHAGFWNATVDFGVTLTANNYFYQLAAFLTAANGSAFESGVGLRYQGSVKFKNTSQLSEGLSAAYQVGLYRGSKTKNAEMKVKTMNTIRRDVRNVVRDFNDDWDADVSKKDMFPFNFGMVYWEQFKVIYKEFWRNVLCSFAVVTVITLILIPDPRTALLVLLSVTLSIVDVLGFMYYGGFTIDAITVSYTVISIGLAVDYSAHVGEAFLLSAQKTRDKRLIDALYTVGASVFNGAFSTFLAVLALGFGETYILRVCFFQFFLVTVLGSAHGLIVLPCLLSIFGTEKI